MSKACICCRIDNAYAELMKHPSESALHFREGGFTAWADRIIPKLEKLRIEGIRCGEWVRRRETRRAHRVKEED